MSNYPNAPPYSPQAPPYNPGPPPPGFHVPSPTTVHTTTVIQTSQFGETPIRVECPNCQAEVVTVVSYEYSFGQHIAFFVMCITAACCICSCVPYCIDSLANVKHTCPRCHSHLGTYRRC